MTNLSTVRSTQLPTTTTTDVSTCTSTTPKLISPADVKNMITNFASSASSSTIASSRAKQFFLSK